MNTKQNNNRGEQGDFRKHRSHKQAYSITNPNLSVSGDWWIKIVTDTPACIYFFGPFDSLLEASEYTDGYQEDLINEGAFNMNIDILRVQPSHLTISSD